MKLKQFSFFSYIVCWILVMVLLCSCDNPNKNSDLTPEATQFINSPYEGSAGDIEEMESEILPTAPPVVDPTAPPVVDPTAPPVVDPTAPPVVEGTNDNEGASGPTEDM